MISLPLSSAFTIVSKNYLAYAFTLAKSLKEHHPEIEFFILLCDEIRTTAELMLIRESCPSDISIIPLYILRSLIQIPELEGMLTNSATSADWNYARNIQPILDHDLRKIGSNYGCWPYPRKKYQCMWETPSQALSRKGFFQIAQKRHGVDQIIAMLRLADV